MSLSFLEIEVPTQKKLVEYTISTNKVLVLLGA